MKFLVLALLFEHIALRSAINLNAFIVNWLVVVFISEFNFFLRDKIVILFLLF